MPLDHLGQRRIGRGHRARDYVAVELDHVDGRGEAAVLLFSGHRHGGFFGVNLNVAHALVQLDGTDAASSRVEYSVGAHLGWRFMITSRFYATAWIGLDRTLNPHDVVLAEHTYEASDWGVFPAIHLGYRFE